MVKKLEMTKKSTNSEVKILEELVKELFALLLLKSVPEVSEDEENEALVVNILGDEESGLLIGARGKTITSLQTVLGLMFKQKTGDWKRIIVNVSDYRQKEEDRLRKLAEETAERAISTGEVQSLYNLNGAQRRIVHMVLSENKDLKTESQGEGVDRFLTITPVKA